MSNNTCRSQKDNRSRADLRDSSAFSFPVTELKKSDEDLQRCAPRRWGSAKGRGANSPPNSFPCIVTCARTLKTSAKWGRCSRGSNSNQQRKHNGGSTEEVDHRPETGMEREKLEETTYFRNRRGDARADPRGSGRGVGSCANGMWEALSRHTVTLLIVTHRRKQRLCALPSTEARRTVKRRTKISRKRRQEQETETDGETPHCCY